MDAYHVTLFLHLLALLAAAVASGLVHLAAARERRAATVAEALEWGRFTGKAARVFPIAVLTLVLTGGFMLRAGGGWSWQSGWVEAGAAGALLLLAGGAVLGARGRRASMALAAQPRDAAPVRTPDPLIPALSNANTGLALAIVFVMTTKPAAAAAFGTLALGLVAGALFGLMRVPARAAAAAPEREPAS